MKYLDEYRGATEVRALAEAIRRITTQPHTIMEICGGQTHAIMKYALDELLPKEIELVHGPGCPVCVTPLEQIDKALAIAAQPDVIFCSFGDMLRVPGSKTDLLHVKATGGDVRAVFSPSDAVWIAQANPEQQVVFFAIGFETTAPANALAVEQARILELNNFSIICAQVLVPPAIDAILSSPANRVQGFLAAGHVCTIMGLQEYEPLAKRYGVPIVVTGFEPVDILQGVHACVKQREEGRAEVENRYGRAAPAEGNPHAQALLKRVFQVTKRNWRGIGEIPESGLCLRPEYAAYDAETRFDVGPLAQDDPQECIAGLILQGIKKPYECPLFGQGCTPLTPVGAPMVSAEGACAAYQRYQRRTVEGAAQ